MDSIRIQPCDLGQAASPRWAPLLSPRGLGVRGREEGASALGPVRRHLPQPSAGFAPAGSRDGRRELLSAVLGPHREVAAPTVTTLGAMGGSRLRVGSEKDGFPSSMPHAGPDTHIITARHVAHAATTSRVQAPSGGSRMPRQPQVGIHVLAACGLDTEVQSRGVGGTAAGVGARAGGGPESQLWTSALGASHSTD